MFLRFKPDRGGGKGLPRASGGVSNWISQTLNGIGSSPRKRGCFLIAFESSIQSASLPRASGGVSSCRTNPAIGLWSSPRKRGCFHFRAVHGDIRLVFPAQAGVFLGFEFCGWCFCSLPRASGGVSEFVEETHDGDPSSPRKRGCFCSERNALGLFRVFPAQAGVFLSALCRCAAASGLPRASGGVSSCALAAVRMPKSSPRKRGCFWYFSAVAHQTLVFPAQAGVFLMSFGPYPEMSGLPRASGGVSTLIRGVMPAVKSSPRKRGCF